MTRHVRKRSLLILVALTFIGCSEPPQPPQANNILKPPKADQIGEFDAAANAKVVDPKPTVTDPITGPLAILKHQQIKLPMLAIEHALNLFNGLEGRYPSSHEEFMTQIIRANNISLPALPEGQQYQYDVENHKLVIVQIDKATP